MMNGRSATLRYGAVSGLCFLLGATLIPLITAAGMHYALATVVVFVIVACVGFGLHCRWTFKVERSFAAFIRYFAAMLANLPLTVLLIGLAHDVFRVPVSIAAPFATTLLVVWNFLAVRWAVVKRVEDTQS